MTFRGLNDRRSAKSGGGSRLWGNVGRVPERDWGRATSSFDHTAGEDHCKWLGILGGAPSRPILSAHFRGNRNQPDLANELSSMSQDGFEKGYPLSIEFRHSYY